MALLEVYDFEKFHTEMQMLYAREIGAIRNKLSQLMQMEIKRRNEANETVDPDKLLEFLAESMKLAHQEVGYSLDHRDFVLLAQRSREFAHLTEIGMTDAGTLPLWSGACEKLKKLEDVYESEDPTRQVAFMRGKLGAVLQAYVATPRRKIVDPGWFGLGCVISNIVGEISNGEIVMKSMCKALKRKSASGTQQTSTPIDRIAQAILATGVSFGYLGPDTAVNAIIDVLNTKFSCAQKVGFEDAQTIIVSPSLYPEASSTSK